MKRDLGPSERAHHLAQRAHVPEDDAGRRALITAGCMLGLCLAALITAATGAAQWHGITGTILLLSGIVELADATTARSTPRAVRVGLAGALPALAGLYLLFALGISQRAAANAVGVFFVVNAVFRGAVAAFDKYPQWRWDVGYAAVTLLLGVLVLAGWPSSSMTMAAYFMALELLARGVSIAERDLAFRRRAAGVERSVG